MLSFPGVTQGPLPKPAIGEDSYLVRLTPLGPLSE